MNARDEAQEPFVMVRLRDLNDALALVRIRALELRDIAVLMALVSHLNWRTGRSQITARGVADELGINASNCRLSLMRLRKQELAVWVVDRHTGESYYLVNPALVATGTAKQHGFVCHQFAKAIEGDE